VTTAPPPTTTAAAAPALPARRPVRVALAGKLVEGVALALLATLVPRVLGPADYGRFALVLALVQVGATALALGGHTAMSRFVPAAPAADRPALARALTVRLALWRVPLLAVIAAAALTLAAAVPERLPPGLVCLALAALALDGAATVLAQAGLGMGRTTLWSFRWPLQTGVLVVGALALSVAWGVTGAIAAIAVAAGAALALTAASVGPALSRAASGATPPPGALRVALLHGISMLLALATARGAIVVVALVAGASAETAYAAVAVGIALAGTALVTQVFTVQLGGLAERVDGEPAAVEDEARRLARRTMVVLLPATLVGAAVLEPLAVTVLGRDFRPATGALAVALGLLALTPLSALTLQSAALRLRPGVRVRASVVAAAVFLVAALALSPAYGALGALGALYAAALAGILYELAAFRSVLDRWVALAGIGGSALVIALGVA